MTFYSAILKRWKRIFICIFLVSGFLIFWNCLPEPLFKNPYSKVILDRNGELLAVTLAKDEQWRFPPLDKVPKRFEQALTAYEDRRFYVHPGVDPLSLIRAVWQNMKEGRVVSGASTLTMQVIRLSREGKPRSVPEKIIEMIIALRLDLTFSKEQILALFASHAPFGGNIVGIDAASWRYFGCDPDKLSWAESAMLAVLPNSPALIHPGRNREILRRKRDRLLDRLEKDGKIDHLTCHLAKQESLPAYPNPIPNLAPHLIERIDKESDPDIFTNSRVRTTLKKGLQTRVIEVVSRHHRLLSSNGIKNAAAIVLEVESGDVLAYMGNIHDLTDSENGNYVDIISSPRSTGSILKPILYSGMLQAGEILPSQLIPDIPTRFGGFAPQNYDRQYQGAVPVSIALSRSLNVPAIRMLQSYGVDRFYELLEKTGMSTLFRKSEEYGLTLIIGGAEGTLWDITGIYAGMARTVNRFFEDNSDNNSLYKSKILMEDRSGKSGCKEKGSGNNRGELIGAGPSWLTFKAMLEVIRPGVESGWRNFTSSQNIAWKTGTSYGYRDGWAVGVTPEHVVGVWVGNADGEGRPGLNGISTAAPILFDIFDLLPKSEWFECPENELIEVDVCGKSGYRAGPYCAYKRKELIPRAGLQSRPCPFCRLIHLDAHQDLQVNCECERISKIRNVKWFVLPPGMEWYYDKRHSDYHKLPPVRSDCMDSTWGENNPSLTLIYPYRTETIYVPLELDGTRGRTVFEAAHRNPEAKIFWHMDNQYLLSTVGIHMISISPTPGRHLLTIVDDKGESVSRSFEVIPRRRKIVG